MQRVAAEYVHFFGAVERTLEALNCDQVTLLAVSAAYQEALMYSRLRMFTRVAEGLV